MMKISTIAKEIEGQLIGPDGDWQSISIDSRKVQKGEVFVAIKGENHDGHDFISEAISRGASAVVCLRDTPLQKWANVSFLQVTDTVAALGKMAAFWRRLHPIPLLGLTGSCGKTTVKSMCEAICQQMGKTLSTKGNLNNHIGLPLTLMRLDDSYQFGVIELGASAIGEIHYLGAIARPSISLVTNVAPAHLMGFGSIDNVAKAKSEIYETLAPEGIAILNIDEPFSKMWTKIIGERRLITFGLKEGAMISAKNIVLEPFHSQFTLHVHEIACDLTIQIPGLHNVRNALAACASGVALGISLDKIVAGLQSFVGVPGRLCRFKGIADAWIIDDSYNANPGSVNAALDVLARCEGKRLFVMGDMAELGENAIDYHIKAGESARQKGIESLLAVGKLSEYAVKAFGKGAKLYPNKEALIADLKGGLTSQSIILVKGSRSSGMEMVAKALIASKE